MSDSTSTSVPPDESQVRREPARYPAAASYGTNDPLADAAQSYGSQVRRELARYPSASKDLLKKFDWSWEDVFSAESDLLRVLPENELRRRARIVYDRFTEVVGAEKSARYATLKVEDCDLDALRADLLQIQSETARQYTLGFQVERERGLLTQFIVRVAMLSFGALVALLAWPFIPRWVQGTILAIGGLIVLGYVANRIQRWRQRGQRRSAAQTAILMLTICIVTSRTNAATTVPPEKLAPPTTTTQNKSNSPDMPLVPLVAVAGMLGATFSILQRAQGSGTGEPLLALFNLRAARRQSYLSIASGAIAALVLFAVFSGGMIEGGLFPRFVNHRFDPKSSFPMKLFDFLNDSGPQTNLDHGKLLVWAFIGGFAERFVPDMLDKFTTSAKK